LNVVIILKTDLETLAQAHVILLIVTCGSLSGRSSFLVVRNLKA
jgi:hypothetical protein